MFPEVVPALEMAFDECILTLLGNHDAVVLQHFEDTPERVERIKACELNRQRIREEVREKGLLYLLGKSPIEHTREGVYFVHNFPFSAKDSHDKNYMLARLSPVLTNPSNPKFSQENSKLVEMSNFPQQVIIRGHSHEPSIYRVKRGMQKIEDCDIFCKEQEKMDLVTLKIEPDFVYMVNVGSAGGAQTMFMKDEELDYRPAGAIVEYSQETGRGKIILFRDSYNPKQFIDSFRNNPLWQDSIFKEANKQVRALEKTLQ